MAPRTATFIRASVDDGPSKGHFPQVQRAYRELAEYYGFLISPCRVRTPQHTPHAGGKRARWKPG